MACVAVRCSVLQCVAVCCNVTMTARMLNGVRFAKCYSCLYDSHSHLYHLYHLQLLFMIVDFYYGYTLLLFLKGADSEDVEWLVLQCVAVCCSVLQCVAVCCSVLQCVAVFGCGMAPANMGS